MYRFAIVLVATLGLVACGGGSSGGSSSGGSFPDNSDGNAGDPGAPDQAGGSGPLEGQIRPGVEVVADGASCTSNFLYRLNAETVYLGVAAHCFSPDTNSGIDACETENLETGFDQVIVENASRPAVLVYSSWRAMQEVGEEPGSNACTFNDFALVKLHPDDISNIHPATRAFGGPTALAAGTAAVGEGIYLYGQSALHGGRADLETMAGRIVAVEGEGWSYDVVTDTPALPGDSGGPVLDSQGRALAVTSALSAGVRVDPLRNGVVNLSRALAYAKEHGFIDQGVSLLTFEQFDPEGGL